MTLTEQRRAIDSLMIRWYTSALISIVATIIPPRMVGVLASLLARSSL